MRIRMNPERERRLARASEVLPEVDEDSKVVDAGLEALVQLDALLDGEVAELQARADELSGEAFNVALYPQVRRNES